MRSLRLRALDELFKVAPLVSCLRKAVVFAHLSIAVPFFLILKQQEKVP